MAESCSDLFGPVPDHVPPSFCPFILKFNQKDKLAQGTQGRSAPLGLIRIILTLLFYFDCGYIAILKYNHN